MRHYLLSRAVYGPGWDLEANQRRLDLFRGVTFPSVAAQTSSDFVWIVALHPEDPLIDQRRAIVERAAGRCIIFDPVRGLDVPEERLRQRMAALAYGAKWRAAMQPGDGGPGRSPTLTTRLDDDDALAPTALARIRANAEDEALLGNPRPVCLQIPEGVRVYRGRYELVRHERNAWCSVLTAPGDGRTVYDWNHKRIGDELPVATLDAEIGWLWVRHRDTLSGKREVSKFIDDDLRDRFPIDWSLLEFGPA